MIRNLNQVTFQGFGTVPPERSQNAKGFDKSAAATVPLSQAEAVIWQAAVDTWVANGNGSSILSVSVDGESYQDFYLDKPVRIKAGVYFSISPFTGPADALLYSAQPPEPRGNRSADSLRVFFMIDIPPHILWDAPKRFQYTTLLPKREPASAGLRMNGIRISRLFFVHLVHVRPLVEYISNRLCSPLMGPSCRSPLPPAAVMELPSKSRAAGNGRISLFFLSPPLDISPGTCYDTVC